MASFCHFFEAYDHADCWCAFCMIVQSYARLAKMPKFGEIRELHDRTQGYRFNLGKAQKCAIARTKKFARTASK